MKGIGNTRKIDKLDFMKIRTFCPLEYTINRVKRQPTGWEKIFANRVSVKELISRIYRKLKLNNKSNQTTQSKKGAKT